MTESPQRFGALAKGYAASEVHAGSPTHKRLHLRQVFGHRDLRVVNRPEVLIGRAADKFDAAGRLTDEPTRGVVRRLLGELLLACRGRPA